VRAVVQYLSDEWMQEAGRALAGSQELSAATEGADLAIRYDVKGAPGGKRSYVLRARDGSVSLEPGDAEATVGFELDYDTAAAIARGELSAQAAFMQGTLKLTGDVTVLIRHHQLLDGLGDALGELRARTEY
jgi:putative sterol carrier protein